MLPYIAIFEARVSTHWISWSLVLLFAVLLLRRWSRWQEPLSYPRIAFLLVTTVISGLAGAKLFHLLFERDIPFGWRWLEAFFQPSGRVFYGSLLGAAAAVFAMSRSQPAPMRLFYWNSAAKLTALSYGILRLQCFADGCCWGKFTSLPIAVVFNHPGSAMALTGVPVHPVQLYEAALGFGLFFLLVRLEKPGVNLAKVFFLIYPVARFALEFLRGDRGRGADIVFGLSTSQLISLWLLATLLALYVIHRLVPERGGPEMAT